MRYYDLLFLFFFFQAEDGIRDLTVTGVQTCALPISPAHAHVLKSHRAQADGVEQVLSVHDDWPFQQVLDLIEIKGTKFRPAGANYQSVDAFGRGVRGLAVTNRAVELHLSFWNGHRIVGTNTGALCNQTLR